VFELEAEKAQDLVVKRLRAGKVADGEHEMVDAGHARHRDLRYVR
jgi:hypothetical protein